MDAQIELEAALARLHAALHNAAALRVPLGRTCYRPSVAETVTELTRYVEHQNRKAEQENAAPAIAAAWRVTPRR